MTYKVSDEVVCKVKDNRIVDANTVNYNRTVTLEVLSVDDHDADDVGYLLFVPSEHNLKGAIKLGPLKIKEYEVEPRFLESNAVYVFETYILRLHNRRDGKCCSKCREFYHLAEANMEDGTLVCYLCRQNRFR